MSGAGGAGPTSSSAAAELAQVDRQLQQIETQIESLLRQQSALQDRREQLARLAAQEAGAPAADWASAAFSWDSQVLSTLRSVFRLSSWRPLQREVINATLQGRDVVCLMPAGGGKSLCYQLPALVAPAGSVTVVVSPLLALIVDQLQHLRRIGVAAAALTSLSSKEELSAVLKSLDQAATSPRLLYVTPERVANSKRFMAKLEKLYKSKRLARIAVDESHCASQWGNDFRPDYRKLGVLRQQFPDAPILALTATATQSVCDDVTSILKIDGAELFRSSVDRPNLFYEIVSKPATATELNDDIAAWIKSNFPNKESGILYALTRKDSETTAEELRQRGISCAAYHADLDVSVRMSVHSAWTEGSLQLIVATVAFGMGVSKSDVRFVLHHSISKSVENYYQESERAGRDGLPAHCRLYFRFSDYLRQAGIVCMDSAWEPHLRGMLRYAAGPSCHRAAIGRHFAEAPAPCRSMCDICAAATAAASASGAAAAAAAAGELQQRQADVNAATKGAVAVLRAWSGAEKRATLTQLLDKLRTSVAAGSVAVAKRLGKDECERLVGAMVKEAVLQLDFGFTPYCTNVYLKVGPKATALEEGRLQINLPPVSEQAAGAVGVAVKQQQHGGGGDAMAAGAEEGGGVGQPEAKRAKHEEKEKEAAAEVVEEEEDVVNLVDSDSDDDFVVGK